MKDFGAFQAWAGSGGVLTIEARQWIAELLRELRRKDEQIAALTARIEALEAP